MKDELYSSMRQYGLGSPEMVAAIVRESDGSLAVVSTRLCGSAEATQGIGIPAR